MIVKSVAILTLFLLSGCAQTVDENAAYHPPMLFVANNQAHIMVLVGGESGIPWSDIAITPTGQCRAEYPTEGELTPGQAVHILGDLAADCTFTISYQGVKVGSYDFGPKVAAQAEAARLATEGKIVTETQTKAPTETKPPPQTNTTSSPPKPEQTNSTVPP